MLETNELFLRFAKDGRAIKDMKVSTLKRLAQESFRLAFGVTAPLKDIVIKDSESVSTAYSIVGFDIARNRYILEKDLNFVSLRVHVGGSACNSRLFICHIDNLTIEDKASETKETA